MNFRLKIKKNNEDFLRVLLVGIIVCVSFACSSSISNTSPLCAKSELYHRKMAYDTIKLLIFKDDQPLIYKDQNTYVVGFFKQLALDVQNICKAPVVIRELDYKSVFSQLLTDSNTVALALYNIPINKKYLVLSKAYLYKDCLTKFKGKDGITLEQYLKGDFKSKNPNIIDAQISLGASLKNLNSLNIITEALMDLKSLGLLDDLIHEKINIKHRKTYNTAITSTLVIVAVVLIFFSLCYFTYKKIYNQKLQIKKVGHYASLIGHSLPIDISIIDVYNRKDFLYYCSESITKIFGGEKPSRADFERTQSKESMSKFIENCKKVLETGKPVRYYSLITFPACGVKEKLIVLKRITLKTQYYIFATFTDVSDLRAAQRLAKENDIKMNSFLSVINHEIRTPLNTIVGFSDILSELEGADKENILKLIIDKSNLLEKMISDILISSKLESGTYKSVLESVDFIEVFNKLKEELAVLFSDKPDIKLNVYIPYKKYSLNIDRNILTYIIRKTSSNAHKFTFKGSILGGFYNISDETVLFIKDTGIGIPYNKMNIVFDRFNKLDEFTEGTGLGMPICKSMTNLLPAGRIGIYSEEGKGTLIWTSFALIDKNADIPKTLPKEIQMIENLRWEGVWYEKDKYGKMVLKGGINE